MSVSSVIESLDMYKLFSTPFIAAQDAQISIASSTIQFLQSFAFEKDASGNNTGVLRTFSINTYVDDPIDSSNGVIVQKQKQLTLPLLTLLNVPALQITKVNVDLTLKIETQTSSQSQSSLDFTAGASAQASASYNVLFSKGSASASVDTRVTSSSSNKESTDSTSSAKYDVHMEAENKTPVGLALILDFCNQNNTAPNRSQNPNGQVL